MLEILVRNFLQMQLDPSGPIASRGRYVGPSVKNVDGLTKFLSPPPPDRIVWIHAHVRDSVIYG